MKKALFLIVLSLFVFCSLNLFSVDKDLDFTIVNYKKYGRFLKVGKGDYSYSITDKKALKEEMPAGIYPNISGILKDPDFKKANSEGKLDGDHWDFIDKKNDPIINFYKWASLSQGGLGERLYYSGIALERAGRIADAVQAFYAIVVHEPKAVSYTYWKTPIYLGKIAIDRINLLSRKYPDLGIKLVDAKIIMKNGFDNTITNDEFIYINPGKIIEADKKSILGQEVDLKKMRVVEERGGSHASVKKYKNGHWQLFVEGKPFFIKALAYSPNDVGKTPDEGTLLAHRDWQIIDTNKNGINDVFFEAYVDANKNNRRDKNEKVVGDAKLMKDMGANTLRLYHHCFDKELFRQLYKEYGFYILLGDLMGAYSVASGADWYVGTDYSNKEQQKNMLESLREMVEEYKDEPYVIMWVLGNETNYGVSNNSQENPQAYYEFVQKAAEFVHKLDPTRPVALCNGDLLFLDHFAEECSAVDVYAANCYRGALGFGQHFWGDVYRMIDRPVFISEYGCPAYANNLSTEEADEGQYEYNKGNWEDIWYNRAGGPGRGNCLGGVLFEWADEWWKAGPDTDHDGQDTHPQFGGPFLDGWSYEEWFGICTRGNGSDTPFLRQFRKSYYYYKDVWPKIK